MVLEDAENFEEALAFIGGSDLDGEEVDKLAADHAVDALKV